MLLATSRRKLTHADRARHSRSAMRMLIIPLCIGTTAVLWWIAAGDYLIHLRALAALFGLLGCGALGLLVSLTA